MLAVEPGQLSQALLALPQLMAQLRFGVDFGSLIALRLSMPSHILQRIATAHLIQVQIAIASVVWFIPQHQTR
jgi:hypothetical protein